MSLLKSAISMSSNTMFPFLSVVTIIVGVPVVGILYPFILAMFVSVNLNFAPSTFPPLTDEVFNNVNFSIIDLFSSFTVNPIVAFVL